jgi:tetratricopeptide (TPR) repeat protein
VWIKIALCSVFLSIVVIPAFCLEQTSVSEPYSSISLPQSNISESWDTVFGGSGNDYARSVISTDDGGYIIAGVTRSYDAENSDVWLIKTDSNGYELWNKTFGGSSDDGAYSVQSTNDGGYILSGYRDNYDKAWLIKTDSNGNELWNNTFQGLGLLGFNYLYSALPTKDNGYVIVGETDSSDTGNLDAWLIKTDSNGNELWNKTFGGYYDDTTQAIQITNDGGYVLAGRTSSYSDDSEDFDAWLIRTDSNGNKLWEKTFDGQSSGDSILSVQLAIDGGFILAGETDPYDLGDWDAWLIKTDSNGNMLWEKTYDSSDDDDTANSVLSTSDGGYAIVGFASLNGSEDVDGWFIKTDSNGNELWNRTIGGREWDDILSVQATSDGGYILAGETKSYGSGNNDVWLIKTNSNGNFIHLLGRLTAKEWLNKGNSLLDQGKYDEALQAFEEAIRLNPQFAEAWNSKGITLKAQGIALRDQGLTLRAKEKLNQAIESYNKALEINPQFVNAWYNEGIAFYDQDEYDKAIQAYDRAIEFDPGFAYAWYNKGIVLNVQGKYEEAIRIFDKAIEIIPLDADVWHSKGVALDALGHAEEAKAAFAKAEELG